MKDESARWVEKLYPLAHKKNFAKGEHIFMAGSPADNFFYVIEGEVRIYKLDTSGKEIEVRRAGKNDIFGEVLVFAGVRFPVSSQAVKDTVIYSYNKNEVLSYTQKDNSLALFFIQTLAKRCLFLNQAIDNVSMQDIPVRLARFLLGLLADKKIPVINNKAILVLPFPKKDLANKLGTIPETLSRVFSKLQTAGLIAVSGRSISILDYSRLVTFSQ